LLAPGFLIAFRFSAQIFPHHIAKVLARETLTLMDSKGIPYFFVFFRTVTTTF
jgi:hypothetical protein